MAKEEQPIGTTGSEQDIKPVRRPVRDRTLSDRVYERIVSMIVEGEFAVGVKLPTEFVLSERLEVSRPVLRQALKQLREDGLVVSRQGSGSYVTRRPDGSVLDFAPVGSIADIQRTFEFRAAIEGEAAYLAAKRRSERDIQKMKKAFDELDRCVRANELGVEADEELHLAICDAADNRYFTTALNSMKANILTGMNLTRNLSLTKPAARLELVQAEHSDILEAIISGDAEAARVAMRLHVDNARKRVFEGS
ncbi:FadR/GntR family transcriptional regulator [Falsihalocynthiibacter sp. SS001]|uniref:FadR/GntR family transcriptional regulator n=1 Tax=Falsihalocynthiibacter sp. SS001 TaxID=3349698 RepID=UPI0036D2F39F